jgi:proteic killer suppression protein
MSQSRCHGARLLPSSQQARQHKGLKRLYEDNSSKGVRPDLVERVVTLLGYLEAAGEIGDLEIPSLRLHPLKGDLKGHWSITVRANWRIIFRFADGVASDIELVDYH